VTVPLPVGPLTPYVTPELLVSAPTGISWSTIPPGKDVTPAQHYAEQLNICMRATAQADEYCNQPLRATTDVETLHGPNYRAVVQTGSGLGRLLLQRWPVLDVLSVKVAPNTFPRQWTTVPSGYYEPEVPVIGLYGSSAPSAAGEGGQAILIQQGYLNWSLGRNGITVQVQYVNGWPHCSLTADTSAGASTVTVDDCTGWALTGAASSQTGATGVVYDGGSQETVQVASSSATTGPGTLTLSSPLMYAHTAGTLVSTLPASIIWAVTLLGTAQALTRGATSTTIHAIPGAGGGTAGGKGPADLTGEAELLLHPYRRTV
jgi:hypothetical protein